jgi:hypothetical protein
VDLGKSLDLGLQDPEIKHLRNELPGSLGDRRWWSVRGRYWGAFMSTRAELPAGVIVELFCGG